MNNQGDVGTASEPKLIAFQKNNLDGDKAPKKQSRRFTKHSKLWTQKTNGVKKICEVILKCKYALIP